MTKRRIVTLDEVREESTAYWESGEDKTLGICALVEVNNMGFCKDGVTRWYHFNLNREPCVYFKH